MFLTDEQNEQNKTEKVFWKKRKKREKEKGISTKETKMKANSCVLISREKKLNKKTREREKFIKNVHLTEEKRTLGSTDLLAFLSAQH